MLGILTLFLAGAGRQPAAADGPRPYAPKSHIATPAGTPTGPPSRASRPRGPAYRVDNGLGSPVA